MAVEFGPIHSRTWVRGSLLTWDGDAKAGYLTVCPDPQAGAVQTGAHVGCCHHAGPTIELDDGVLVDTDAEGHVLGVEVLGHEVGISDLLIVLRWLLEEDGTEEVRSSMRPKPQPSRPPAPQSTAYSSRKVGQGGDDDGR